MKSGSPVLSATWIKTNRAKIAFIVRAGCSSEVRTEAVSRDSGQVISTRAACDTAQAHWCGQDKFS